MFLRVYSGDFVTAVVWRVQPMGQIVRVFHRPLGQLLPRRRLACLVVDSEIDLFTIHVRILSCNWLF